MFNRAFKTFHNLRRLKPQRTMLARRDGTAVQDFDCLSMFIR